VSVEPKFTEIRNHGLGRIPLKSAWCGLMKGKCRASQSTAPGTVLEPLFRRGTCLISVESWRGTLPL